MSFTCHSVASALKITTGMCAVSAHPDTERRSTVCRQKRSGRCRSAHDQVRLKVLARQLERQTTLHHMVIRLITGRIEKISSISVIVARLRPPT